MRRWIINACRSNNLHGSLSRLTVSTINLIWITSLCHGGLTACDSSIVKNSAPAMVTLKYRCMLIIDRRRHLLGCITFKCSSHCLTIAQRRMFRCPTGGWPGTLVAYCWCSCSLSSHIILVWCYEILRLTRRVFGLGRIQNFS